MTPYRHIRTGKIFFRDFSEEPAMMKLHDVTEECLPMRELPEKSGHLHYIPTSDMAEIRFALYVPTGAD